MRVARRFGGIVAVGLFLLTIVSRAHAEYSGGTGKTTAGMQMAKTFLDAGWDFRDETAHSTEDIWWIDEGKDQPRLWWELIPEK
jgi:hypothetical protein